MKISMFKKNIYELGIPGLIGRATKLLFCFLVAFALSPSICARSVPEGNTEWGMALYAIAANGLSSEPQSPIWKSHENTGFSAGLGVSAFRRFPQSQHGLYLGIDLLAHTAGDAGIIGNPDVTLQVPVGISIFRKNMVIAPYVSPGIYTDNWDSWDLGGYLCGEVGSEVGCETKNGFEVGAGISFLFKNKLMLGISASKNAGIAFSIGMHNGSTTCRFAARPRKVRETFPAAP